MAVYAKEVKDKVPIGGEPAYTREGSLGSPSPPQSSLVVTVECGDVKYRKRCKAVDTPWFFMFHFWSPAPTTA